MTARWKRQLDEAALRARGARAARGRRARRWRCASSTASCAPTTRQTARRILAEEFPEAFACVSHEVAPEFREYERMSHRRGERLSRPGDAALHQPPRASGWPSWACSAAPHLTQSNGGVIGFEQAARLPVRTVLSGPSTGVVARAGGRAAGRDWQPDHLRHGRHQHRRRAAAGRRVPAGQRGGGARLSDQGADAGYPHRRRRRRLDRLCRQRRAAEGRAAQRRRRSRPGLLRQGQHGADGHRRQRRAADAESDASAGRPDGGATRTWRKAAIGRLAEQLGMDADGDGAGYPRRRDRQHGARHPGDQRAARPRSARLHAGGVRRRRPAACGAAGEGAGDRPHPGAAQSRHPVRHGPAADRSARRFRRDPAADAWRGRAAGDRGRRSPRCGSRRTRGSPRKRSPRTRAGSPARWTCAMPGRTTNCRCRCRTAPISRRRSTCWRKASPRRTSGCTASSPRANRCSSSPSAIEATGLVRKAAFQPHPRRGPDASAAIVGRREVWLPEARRFRLLSGL